MACGAAAAAAALLRPSACSLLLLLLLLAPAAAALLARRSAASTTNWIPLGMEGISNAGTGEDAEALCRSLSGLVSEQVRLCATHPGSMRAVSEGARKGILECQYQFRNERWNCTTFAEGNVLSYTLQRGNRETAFVYAVVSSGVVHSVTQACSSGNFTECGCGHMKDGLTTPQGWKWGGCSDNIRYGIRFAREFIDAPDNQRLKQQASRARSLMNLHNNQAGREVVNQLIRMHCRCHGISGSCEVKTCWKTLPPFEKVGDYLKAKYERAVQIPRANKRQLKHLVRVKRRSGVEKTDLVHIHKSPDYCVPDERRGIPGTSGRVCNKTSRGSDSCDRLCCGRGHNTQVIKHMERCQCKFVWCCEVKCRTCVTVVGIHTCK